MKLYHYSKIESWEGIKKGSWKSDDIPGLGASQRLCLYDQEGRDVVAVFAHLEPLPPRWTQNKNFEGIWEHFKTVIGHLLLEIEVDLEVDKIYVVDGGHIASDLVNTIEGVPKKYLHKNRLEAEQYYMQTKISLEDYLDKKDELNYSLPEVIIANSIPFERIKVSELQPLLKEDLENYQGEFREELIKQIKGIPGLANWYNKYFNESLATNEMKMR